MKIELVLRNKKNGNIVEIKDPTVQDTLKYEHDKIYEIVKCRIG